MVNTMFILKRGLALVHGISGSKAGPYTCPLLSST
jgi:hypothetical protein